LRDLGDVGELSVDKLILPGVTQLVD